MTDRMARRQVARRLLMVNAGWVVIGLLAAALRSPGTLSDLGELVLPLGIAGLVMHVLALVWLRGVRRRGAVWPCGTLREGAMWYLRSMAFGTLCALLLAVPLSATFGVSAMLDPGFDVHANPASEDPTGQLTPLLVFLVILPIAAIFGVVLGFTSLVIPVVSPLVVLSWEWAIRSAPTGAAGDPEVRRPAVCCDRLWATVQRCVRT